MTNPLRTRGRPARGLTLLEMSVVIGVILALVSVTFAGANAWKNGTSRTQCIVNIRNIQQAVRCYQNVHGYNPGAKAVGFDGTQSIARQLYSREYIRTQAYNQILGIEQCPGGGYYQIADVQRFPLPGELFIRCSLAESQQHMPETGRDW